MHNFTLHKAPLCKGSSLLLNFTICLIAKYTCLCFSVALATFFLPSINTDSRITPDYDDEEVYDYNEDRDYIEGQDYSDGQDYTEGQDYTDGQDFDGGHNFDHELKKRDTSNSMDDLEELAALMENLSNETAGGIRCPVGTEFCTSVGACSEDCGDPTGRDCTDS